jgi:hypothetical protein
MNEKLLLKKLVEMEGNIIETLEERLDQKWDEKLMKFKDMYYTDRDYMLSETKTLREEMLVLQHLFKEQAAKVNRLLERHDRQIYDSIHDIKKMKVALDL